MGIWTRMKRSVRALFGGIIEKTEDPELILQQTIRDMRDRVPELMRSGGEVMAPEKLLAKNKERLETQVVDLDSKIRASVKMGRDDIATAYIGQLQQAQLDLQKTSQQLEHANLASKQALKARDNYVLQMQRRTAHARAAVVDKPGEADKPAGTACADNGIFRAWRRRIDVQRDARQDRPARRGS